VIWDEYFKIYPFREYREDERTAQICQVIGISSGRLKKNLPLDTFMPEYYKPNEGNLAVQTAKALAFRERLKEVYGDKS
jgi:hypothetical protein